MATWLNEADVRRALSMQDLILAMQEALRSFSAGCVHQPVRTVIEIERNSSFAGVMPAYASALPALGAKFVTVFQTNAARGLPSHLASILLLDPHTGALLALLDGRFITEARTAAVSAVAVRLLASERASSLAILGSGVQARSHLEALTLVRNFSDIRAWSPTPANLERFVEEFPQVQPAASAAEAVRHADVVVLATASAEPVIQNHWVKPGACVISVGACRPNQREIDPALVARARLFVDSRAAALQESGDIVLGIAENRFAASHIVAELGEVVHTPALGRRNDSEVTLFKSLGLAIEDVAAAHLAYQQARASGWGLEFA